MGCMLLFPLHILKEAMRKKNKRFMYCDCYGLCLFYLKKLDLTHMHSFFLSFFNSDMIEKQERGKTKCIVVSLFFSSFVDAFSGKSF